MKGRLEDLRPEVVVIGGGVAGVSSAWFLAKAGVPVVLCEKGRITAEQSSRNWGWIRKQGRDPRELPASVLALRLWERISGEIGEDIGWYKGGVTYLAETPDQLGHFEAWLSHARDHQLDSHLLSPAETDAAALQRCSVHAERCPCRTHARGAGAGTRGGAGRRHDPRGLRRPLARYRGRQGLARADRAGTHLLPGGDPRRRGLVRVVPAPSGGSICRN
jgi:choline dehydrogenase-like flavoprotein